MKAKGGVLPVGVERAHGCPWSGWHVAFRLPLPALLPPSLLGPAELWNLGSVFLRQDLGPMALWSFPLLLLGVWPPTPILSSLACTFPQPLPQPVGVLQPS